MVHTIEAPLLALLDELGISYVIHRHPPLRTVDESRRLRGAITGRHIKNLLLRDKKRTLWLVTVPEDRRVDLKALRPLLGARGTLSFAQGELLAETLAVAPGALTPLAVLNDRQGRVTAIIDEDLLDPEALINCHPLHNEATLSLTTADLITFMGHCGHRPRPVRVPARE